MSLFKQLSIMLSLFLATILSLVMILNFKTASEFVQNQLYTDAKNTAHSLGLSLSKVADPEDSSSMDTMINAIFDSGYYQSIRLVDLDGKVVYERHNDMRVSDVPHWFISMVTINNATAKSDIMIGWSQFGTLHVSGHTGNAYRQLYTTFIKLIETFLIIGTVIFILLYLMLSLSLQSLKRIRNQAQAIIDNQFIFEDKIPFTTEFRSVAVAMNATVGKVKDIFERENETLKRYQDLLYKDGQTKLFNRRYVISKIPDYLQADSELSHGSFAMFSIDEPEHLKKMSGYQLYNDLIGLLASQLNERFAENKSSMIARMNEGDFLVMLPFVNQDLIIQESKKLLVFLSKELEGKFDEVNVKIVCGASEYDVNDTLKSLFTRADNAIIQAKGRGSYEVFFVSNDNASLSLGREEWRTQLLLSIEESRFLLAFQSVVSMSDETQNVLHEEIFLRLLDREGIIHSAGYFIPIASELDMMDILDKAMIMNVLNYLESKKLSTAMALNLSREFISKPVNLTWLKATLEHFAKENSSKLWFEITNNTAINSTELVVQVSSMIKSFGYYFGVDHFVLPDVGAHYLQTIRPDYVKSNAAYLSDMMIDKESGNSRESLNNLARSLGITIIAIMIENNEQMEELQKLGLTHFQGSYVAPVAML